MLKQKTREVLSQLGQINQSQIITYPVTTIILGRAIQAFLDMETLEEEPFEEFGVYDINQLNSVIDVLEDPSITMDNGVMNIVSGNQSIKYGTTNIDIIESECRGNPDLLQRIKNNTLIASFDLDSKELERLKKMASLLKELSDMVITSTNEEYEINISVTSKEKSSNDYKVQFQCDVREDFSLTVVMDIVKKLPNSDYGVSIYKSNKGSLVTVFESKGVPGLELVVASKANV